MYYDITLPIAMKENFNAWTEADALPAACMLAEQRLAMATHLKSSGFMFNGARTISKIELEKLIGNCHVVRIPEAAKQIELKHLMKSKIMPHSKLILKTKVSSEWKKAGKP